MSHATQRRRAFAPRNHTVKEKVRPLELHKPAWSLYRAMRDLEKMKWETADEPDPEVAE
jgi:hypothetical protein